MARLKTIPRSQWAIDKIHVRPAQKKRFDKIFGQMHKCKTVIYASDLFEIMLKIFEQARMKGFAK
jgi:hypothetical protein